MADPMDLTGLVNTFGQEINSSLPPSTSDLREHPAVDALVFMSSPEFLNETPTPLQRIVIKTTYGLWPAYPTCLSAILACRQSAGLRYRSTGRLNHKQRYHVSPPECFQSDSFRTEYPDYGSHTTVKVKKSRDMRVPDSPDYEPAVVLSKDAPTFAHKPSNIFRKGEPI